MLRLVSDSAVRLLERLAAAGDIHAAARLLTARVRSGELHENDILLAAHLGHRPALIVTGGRPDPRSPWSADHLTADELGQAVLGLAAFGRRPLAQSALTAAELSLPWAHEHLAGSVRIYLELLELARAWLDDRPTDQRRLLELTWGPPPSPFRGPGLCARLAAVSTHLPLDSAAQCASAAVMLAVDAVGSVMAVRDAIRRELLP